MTANSYFRLAKEGSWIIIGQIAAVLGSLVLVRVLTEYLDPTQYGQLALGLTVAGLVNQVVMGGVIAGIGRFYSIAAEIKDSPGYLHASRQLMGHATVVVVLIALALITGLLYFGYSDWIGLTVAALGFSILSGYNASLSGIQNAARQRATVAFHGGLDAWLKILLAVGAMLWLGQSSTAVVMGYAMSSLLTTGSQFFFLRRLIPSQGAKRLATENWTQQMWAYARPFSAWGVFTWAQQASDRWALQRFASTEDVGLYAVVFQLGYTPIGLVTGIAMSFLGPILYQRSGYATDPVRNASVHRMAWYIAVGGLAVTLLATGITFFMHELVFRLLVAERYAVVSYLLPWVVMAGGLFAAGQMLALKLMSEMKSAAMTITKMVTAVLGIGLNIYGAAKFGSVGVVAALVAFSGIYFCWMAWLSQNPPLLDNKIH